MVDLRDDVADLFLDGLVELIGEGEVVRLVAQTDDLVGQRDAAFAALAPNLGQSNVDAQLAALILDELQLGLGVLREAVDGHNARQLVDLGDVPDMLQQVGQALLQSLEVLDAGLGLRHATVILQGADGGNEDDAARLQAGHAALDVEELLSTQVSAEAGLGDGVVGQVHGDLRRGDGVAAMGDVGERAAVDEGRSVLERLHEVRLQSVLQQGGHGALGVQITGGDGLLVVSIADDQAGQAGLQVRDVGGQAENCHDLGGDGDVVAVLTRGAVDAAAEAVDDEAELTVVHIDAAAPGDAARVDVEAIALINMVIQHGSQQVVGSADGVEVAGEVEVDILHRDDLRIAAAGRAALDAEDRAEGRLTQSDKDVLAELAHTVGQADRRGGLAFACGGGVDGGDEDELTLRVGLFLQDAVVDLGLILAVLLQILLVDARGLGDLSDGLHGGFLCNFDIRLKTHDGCSPSIKFARGRRNGAGRMSFVIPLPVGMSSRYRIKTIDMFLSVWIISPYPVLVNKNLRKIFPFFRGFARNPMSGRRMAAERRIL